MRSGVWLHRSWATVPPFGRVAANGLVVVGESEALLIDTPWNDTQTEWVFSEVRRRFAATVTKVVITHAHDDRLGGLARAHQLGAVTYAADRTREAARRGGKPLPERVFSGALTLAAADTSAELFYPGPGHVPDNTVVFLPDTAVLFGGCLIKDAAAQSLGNTAEADLAHWEAAIAAVEKRFSGTTLVVPGHGEPGDLSLLAHSRELVRAAQGDEVDGHSPKTRP